MKIVSRYRSLQIPEELCAQAERWLRGRFNNLEDLVAFALEEIIKEESAKLDQQEEEMVQQRLKDLGYI